MHIFALNNTMDLSNASLPLSAIIKAPFGFIGLLKKTQHVEIVLLTQAIPVKPNRLPSIEKLATQIRAYLSNPNAPLDLPPAQQFGTPYQQAVWTAIRDIPAGETRSYGQIAQQLGSGARAVANACGANPLPLVVPCHRVVAAQGLGGFMQNHPQGRQIKQWLLTHEQAFNSAWLSQ